MKRTMLRYNGAILPLPELIYWATVHGGGSITPELWKVADVASGAYQLCSERMSGGEVCDSGTLSRGGSLTLTVK
jgi:hypothetical protein